MRTLFSKIFLWFFCAQVLLGTAMFAVGFSQREATTPQPVRQMLGEELRRQSASALLLARAERLQDLRFEPAANGTRTTIFWRDKNGRAVATGDSPTAAMRDLAASAAQNAARSAPEMQWQQSNAAWSGALAAPTERGPLVVVRQIPRYPRSFFGFLGDWQTPEGRTRLVTALGVMALVCYALARTIAAPVTRLRAATQRLTEGDLEARVTLGQPLSERGGDELAALGRDFNRMAARLQASTASEKQLLGDISHELRSPLARLSVALDLVEQNRARAQTRGETLPETAYLGALERIRRESGRLNEMIGQLLELTRLESRAPDAPLAADAHSVALDALVAEVVADAKFEAHGRGCDVVLLENQPCALHGLESLLHSAIENVVRNAVRYTAPQTGVEVTLHRAAADTAVLRVRDHGPGVPEASLDALFRPFYRVAQGRDRQSGGVGLGLAIAERALRVHGASIKARNAQCGGLEIEIRLPLLEKAATSLPVPLARVSA